MAEYYQVKPKTIYNLFQSINQEADINKMIYILSHLKEFDELSSLYTDFNCNSFLNEKLKMNIEQHRLYKPKTKILLIINC